MKALITALLLTTQLFAALQNNELTLLEELILITKKNLMEEERLFKVLCDFQKKRESFIQNPDSAKLATALVRAALRVEEEIKEGSHNHLLSQELLDEVHFFSQVGKGLK